MDVKKVLAKFDELIDEATKVSAEREANVARTGESVISPVGYYRLFSSSIALLTYLQAKTYVDLVHSVRDPNPGILRGILESARREFSFGLISHPRLLLYMTPKLSAQGTRHHLSITVESWVHSK